MIREAIGDRTSAVKEADQNKLRNDHIFKRGENKDILVEEYVSYLERMYDPSYMEDIKRSFFTGLYDAFSTSVFRKKNDNFSMENFCTFWKILAGVDAKLCKRVFTRGFSNPLTLEGLLEEFVQFVSLDEFVYVESLRVFLILKALYEVVPFFD